MRRRRRSEVRSDALRFRLSGHFLETGLLRLGLTKALPNAAKASMQIGPLLGSHPRCAAVVVAVCKGLGTVGETYTLSRPVGVFSQMQLQITLRSFGKLGSPASQQSV